jgi:hypothetical protein
MAKLDEKLGAKRADIKSYQDLNRGLEDSFDPDLIRVDEGHKTRALNSQKPHGHVGAVDHIEITHP